MSNMSYWIITVSYTHLDVYKRQLQQNCLSECEFSAVNSALSLSSGFLVFLYLRNGNKSTHPSFPDPIIQSPGIQVFSDAAPLTVPRQIRIFANWTGIKVRNWTFLISQLYDIISRRRNWKPGDIMTKKIAVINDLSGFGKCSLTAAISVIASMGVQPCPLPTAILSAQTGYPSYFCDDYTDKMDEFRKEWKKMGESFDGIYTGFMAGGRQIEKVFDFLDDFYTGDTFLLADPVMGDNGRKYDMFTPELLSCLLYTSRCV